MSKVKIVVQVGTLDGRRVPLLGRDAWACLQLVAAGSQGVTAIERVGSAEGWHSDSHREGNPRGPLPWASCALCARGSGLG
jgi:hypothetical protein